MYSFSLLPFAQIESINFSTSEGSASWWLLLISITILVVRYGVRYSRLWLRIRTITRKQTVVPEYVAPPNIPPAFFGIMIDNRGSMQDMNATILSLVSKGLLRMEYDDTTQDIVLHKTNLRPMETLMPHEQYIYDACTAAQPCTGARLREQSNILLGQFSFLLMQDLQTTGYYKFHPKMATLTAPEYYIRTTLRAIRRGLLKPWNWPGLLVSLFMPFVGIAWLIISVIYYNRLGLYNYRTKLWEQSWPQLAGYYNYLRMVEAEKRLFALSDIHQYKPDQHDPYLTAAQLQKTWDKYFAGAQEIGAGGREYRVG